MSYSQLTEGQRYQIHSLKGIGFTQKNIATHIRVHPSTISRELIRNTGQRSYRPKQAHERAIKRRHETAKARAMTRSNAAQSRRIPVARMES